jgi:hypothetical protein
MAYIKFSFFFFFVVSLAQGQSRFSTKSCIDASYNMKMVQQGPLFGLLKHEFTINKKDCVVQVIYNKYFPKEWVVDVCREPVHIKATSATGVDVAKKDTNCVKMDNSRDTGNFCSQYFALMEIMQDEGLIFAQGDRDNLQSDHGKVYCSYLLLRKYLNEGVVFSRYTESPDIFLEGQMKQKGSPVPTETPENPDERPEESGTAPTAEESK